MDRGVVIGGPFYYPDYGYAPGYYPDFTADNSIVVDVQQELAREGYYRGAIDGIIDSGTRSAIVAYQRDHGLPVNGQINVQLIELLGLG
jgi:peptidoglycan hydrolase-like protein with peptidoglycan-binding domain